MSSLPDVGFLGGICQTGVNKGFPPFVARVLAFLASEVYPGDGEGDRTCHRDVAEEGSHCGCGEARRLRSPWRIGKNQGGPRERPKRNTALLN